MKIMTAMDLYYFDNYQYQDLSFDFLKGLFNAFEFLNHHANRGYELSISEYETAHCSVEGILQSPTDENITFSLLNTTKDQFEQSLQNWFFGFTENITSHERGHNYLMPKEQAEFIRQIMGLIEKIVQPISFHLVQTSQFSYAFGLFHDWFIIVAKDKFYNFQFSWSD